MTHFADKFLMFPGDEACQNGMTNVDCALPTRAKPDYSRKIEEAVVSASEMHLAYLAALAKNFAACKKMKIEILTPITEALGSFPLDNLSDAFVWADQFESVVAGRHSRITDLEAAVRDGEYGDTKEALTECLENLLYEVEVFQMDVVEVTSQEIDNMITDGMGDFEDDDEGTEGKQELCGKLEWLLGNVETELTHLYN